LIIVNAYGISSATIDAATEAKRLGGTVAGMTPPVWMRSKLPGGDEANRQHMEKHLRRIKFL